MQDFCPESVSIEQKYFLTSKLFTFFNYISNFYLQQIIMNNGSVQF